MLGFIFRTVFGDPCRGDGDPRLFPGFRHKPSYTRTHYVYEWECECGNEWVTKEPFSRSKCYNCGTVIYDD
jgi:hypothetical protein